jgi:hypothetical protein
MTPPNAAMNTLDRLGICRPSLDESPSFRRSTPTLRDRLACVSHDRKLRQLSLKALVRVTDYPAIDQTPLRRYSGAVV